MQELPVIQEENCRSAVLLDYIARHMRLRAEAALTPLGLRPRHLVALTMLRDGETVTQQALSSILQIDGANVVGLLNELETAGLVTRRRAPEDRRRHLVELTDQGHRQLAHAEFTLAGVEDEVLSALTHEQRCQLAGLLRIAATGTFPA